MIYLDLSRQTQNVRLVHNLLRNKDICRLDCTQPKVLQEMLQENLWRLLCFHKWHKHCPNFCLLLLLLLWIDLVSIISTKNEQRCI